MCKFCTHHKTGLIERKKQTRILEYYNFDIILAVGYRTKSSTAIKFRKWATQTLKEHISKGFTINTQRIEQNRQAFLKAVEDMIKLKVESIKL